LPFAKVLRGLATKTAGKHSFTIWPKPIYFGVEVLRVD
jgi:hypothetical protein